MVTACKKSRGDSSQESVGAKEIIQDLGYLHSKVNWGTSFLDAKAVTIMNEFSEKIRKLEKQSNE